ncbi:hypothetical protein [Chromobacterium haemolyticum]|uniref:hypothetical protein n=1 Tax=Chromobacterium haemolyticum TaxID=394935 RepID=UPI000D314993|nr:hypothetical protein [Chromobacterium haemolyticum]PTU71380.1 hypothetical protein DBB33_18945 [Chromobacterium haemolyticum]
MMELSLIHALPEGPWAALDLKAIQAQLEALATQPATLAADKASQWLGQWLRLALALAERLQLLQALRAPLAALVARLERAAARQELSCTPEARAALQSARQLLRQWHEQCKLLAQAFSAQEAGRFSSSRPRLEALQLALASGYDLLALHARSYAPLHKGFWRDCHRLYAYALAQGWEGRQAAGGVAAPGLSYRRLMLLGLTASNRLETAKIALLLQWLEQHAGLLRVEQLDQPLGDDGALAFRADADRPARFCAELDLDGDGVWWRLDAGRLLERLDELSRQRQRQGLDGGHEAWLLARLRQEWGAPPRRRHVRLRRLSVETVELVSLLPRCWRLAAGEPADGELEPCRLQISNLSASGLLLQGESLQQPLRAGEVVMLRRRGFGWQLGLVRWVSFGGEDMQTECGVEFIGKRPQAVEVAAVTSHAAGGFEPALRMQAERHFRHSGILVLPGRLYQALRPFHLRGADGECRVRAVRLLQQTAHYQFVEIKIDELLPADAQA